MHNSTLPMAGAINMGEDPIEVRRQKVLMEAFLKDETDGPTMNYVETELSTSPTPPLGVVAPAITHMQALEQTLANSPKTSVEVVMQSIKNTNIRFAIPVIEASFNRENIAFFVPMDVSLEAEFGEGMTLRYQGRTLPAAYMGFFSFKNLPFKLLCFIIVKDSQESE